MTRFFFSKYTEEPEPKDFIDYLDSLKNYEKLGVAMDAGTDSDDGLDLGRMRRLMDRLGNPQSRFKVQAFIFFLSVFLSFNVVSQFV
ncbi:hypothetical protein OIU76_022928 [Salix suchowensis]|nr:hypothetical protein OIU76_022928 [Salix suchowensis]